MKINNKNYIRVKLNAKDNTLYHSLMGVYDDENPRTFGLSHSEQVKDGMTPFENLTRNTPLINNEGLLNETMCLPLSFKELYTTAVPFCSYTLEPLRREYNGWTLTTDKGINCIITHCYSIPKGRVKTNEDGTLTFTTDAPVYINAGKHSFYEVGLWISDHSFAIDTPILTFKHRVPVNYGFYKSFKMSANMVNHYEELRTQYPNATLYTSVSGYFGSGVLSWQGVNGANGQWALK